MPAAQSSWRPKLPANVILVAVIALTGVVAAAVQLAAQGRPGASASPAPLATAAADIPRVRDAAVAFDHGSGDVVLVGGFDSGTGLVLGRTWTWNRGGWVRRDATVAPPSREAAVLLEDRVRHQLILLGGFGPGGLGPLRDMWAWSGGAWHQLADPAPQFVLLPAVAWDTPGRRLVLVGQCATSTGSEVETWSWDGSTWRQLRPAHEPAIDSRAIMSDAAAAGGGLVLLASGPGGRGQTWTFLGGDWHPGPALPTGYEPNTAKVATSDRGDVVLTVEPRLTLVWDGARWRSGPAAPAVRQGALVSTGTIVLFGGDVATAGLTRAWRLSGAAWTPVTGS